MMLNERKIKILEAIINDYIQTAEPIGSRTIAKKYDLGISSATIRNEMSDLEELGFIVQPHTSAGRVPSDKGYRLYVDRLMPSRELSRDEANFLLNMVQDNISHIDYLMQQTAKVISHMTNYTTVVTEPKSRSLNIKHLQLVPLDSHRIVAVIITDSKSIKNQVIDVGNTPDSETLNKFSSMLNELLKADSDETKRDILNFIERENKDNAEFIRVVLDEIYKTFREYDDVHIYTSGVKNILAFPEFSNIEKAKVIFQTLEEKEMLITLLNAPGGEGNVQILIGDENKINEFKDCSIVKTNYSFGDNAIGSIGIIGPKRMDYSQSVAILNNMVKNINRVIKALSGG